MIYLDNAATTNVLPEVLDAMLPYFTENYGNPSALYSLGIDAKHAIERAREQIAEVINADPDEIYFTSGGTEADNWAVSLFGIGSSVAYSAIEHHAIANSANELMHREWIGNCDPLDVDKNGIIDIKSIDWDYYLCGNEEGIISVMTANNEIGTIQPVKEVAKIAKKYNSLFHTDAVQAFCQIPIDVKDMGVDLLSASGHKIHAPKGVGFLYIRRGLDVPPLIYGGGQERGMRSGTENVPAIVGFGVAAEYMHRTMKKRAEYMTALRDYMIDRLTTEIPYCYLNGSREHRLPNNVNVSFKYVEGEALVLGLSNHGICCSAGSACTSGSLEPSHVLKAIGLPDDLAHGALRLTLSEQNTREEIDYTINVIKQIVQQLRELNPTYWRECK